MENFLKQLSAESQFKRRKNYETFSRTETHFGTSH